MPGAARDVHTLADLCARADGRPGIDHAAFADIGTQIDKAWHQHRAFGNKGTAAHHGARNNADTGFAEPVVAPALELERHLVKGRSTGRAELHHGVVAQTEREQHRFLKPLVDLPAACAIRFRNPRLAAVEQFQRRIDKFAHIRAGRGDAVARFPGAFDCGFELGHVQAPSENGSGARYSLWNTRASATQQKVLGMFC